MNGPRITFLGKENLKNALRNADFVFNAIQVGGYDPATIASANAIPAGLLLTIKKNIKIISKVTRENHIIENQTGRCRP